MLARDGSSEELIGVEESILVVTHMALGKRPQFLIGCWKVTLVPHQVGLPILLLKCPCDMTAVVLQRA